MDKRKCRPEPAETLLYGKKTEEQAEGSEEKQYNVQEGIPDGLAEEAAPDFLEEAGKGMPERKKQGGYTLEDYLALPRDQRWELIDGVLTRMEAPTTMHQMIVGDLFFAIRRCLESQEETHCMVFVSPTDVQLDLDDRTVVEPDLIILCSGEKLRMKRIFGAPDFVAEVLSPSTQSRDMILKNYKYQKAGVREYWIIDPEGGKVIVNEFDRERPEFTSRIYDFHAKIPVAVSEGKCLIDFEKINRNLEKAFGPRAAEAEA